MMQKQGTLCTSFDDAIKIRVSPFLKKLGFAKKGLVWNRKRKNFVDVIEFQTSKKSSSKDKLNFTMNFGIFIPKINDYIFEFFDSNERIKKFLLQEPRWYNTCGFGKVQLAVFLVLNNNIEKGRELFQSIINEKKSWSEVAVRVAQKLGLTLF